MIFRALPLIVALAATASLACVVVPVESPRPITRVYRPGPPPHAPAHGHRHKHHAHGVEVELVFDTGLGVYAVVGWPGHYYREKSFFRVADGAWQVSAHIDSGWVAVSDAKLPPGLAKKHGPSKARGPKWRGPHPAKHRD